MIESSILFSAFSLGVIPDATGRGASRLIALTDVQVFSLYNILCLSAVIFISGIVSRHYPNKFFPYWMRAYLCIGTLLLAEFLVLFTGRNLLWDAVEFLVAPLAGWQLTQAANVLRSGQPRAWWLPYLLGVATVTSIVLDQRGVPYQTACMPAFLAYMAGFAYLGFVLMHGHNKRKGTMTRHLGLPVAAFVLWTTLIYPLCMGTPLFWLGFLVAGVLQLVIGGGMVLFVVEDSAAQLREQNEQLRQLDIMKDHLLGMVSHELRTPISSINTATFLLSSATRDTLDPRQAELVEIIRQNISLLGRLVVDILEFTKLENGMLRYEMEEEDLGIMVSDAVRSLQPQFQEKELLVDVDLPVRPLYAQFDRVRLTQVVCNLLDNAIKFTPRGGHVRVRLTNVEDAFALIEVIDNGPGIPDEHVARIFDKFYQADSTTRRKLGGLGLGLAIARAIIEEGHHGQISVESATGGGARFWVRFPLASGALKKNEATYA